MSRIDQRPLSEAVQLIYDRSIAHGLLTDPLATESIMLKPGASPPCRFSSVPTGAEVSFIDTGFCAFDLPNCRGCPNDRSPIYISTIMDDPMSSKVLISWLHGQLRAPS